MPRPPPGPGPAPRPWLPDRGLGGGPAHNEEENIPALVEQVGAALSPLGIGFEFIVVDDGSTDATREVARSLMADRPWLRCLSMANTPGLGQRPVRGVPRRVSRPPAAV